MRLVKKGHVDRRHTDAQESRSYEKVQEDKFFFQLAYEHMHARESEG